MRKEPFTVGNYLHVIKRGARGMPIVREESDKWRFLKLLCHLNDEYHSEYWEDDLKKTQQSIFDRPGHWPKQRPLVEVLAYTLMNNHFHLILKETVEGGVAKFMQKMGGSMTNHYNSKYKERGSIFQGSYKSRTITDDVYLRYVAVYVMVKNPFELYPGGLEKACKNFDDAFAWTLKYPFTSLADYAGDRNSAILQRGILGKLFSSPRQFKSFAKDCINGRKLEVLKHRDIE